ncbi:hypothetical protein O1611_g4787 [Lasiodiplodia mahajangana]|uniref:Uncharacterized protein n=1 Tax=Lasiodiplodia mahajangana TaxID=1108764 RepID=A0ACC2JN00_9PEZI|nr:hypothetical protein O1611_g4787 [Lasiodiplodia mahajangana]
MADSSTDWISAITSTIAAAISIVTLITVYVAARQLLTEHRAYQLGLSPDTLGPWHDKVKRKRLLGLQQEICTPTITVPMLLKQEWKPNFVFPLGTPSATPSGHPDPERALASASWVNFTEALGLRPDDNNFYYMSAQSTLVNGIVPMRWAGKDLVGVCAMLGFQSSEGRPSSKEPMKLPMQWSGPLGWLQFRDGPNGCVVEFRRRANIANQLPTEQHKFYAKESWTPESDCLSVRLWRSINGFMIKDNKALYLGGTDRRAARRETKRTLVELENHMEDFDTLMAKGQDDPKIKTTKTTTSLPEPGGKRKNDEIFDNLMQTSSQDEIVKIFQNANRTKSKSETDTDTDVGEHLKDLLQRMREKELGKMEVLTPHQGLLSVVIQGELVNSRGLSTDSCKEYGRAYFELSEVDQKAFPYKLGDLFMDETLLKLMKEAMGILKPDGFFFTPTRWLASDVNEVYSHVRELCDDPEKENGIFTGDPDSTNGLNRTGQEDNNDVLYHAMMLCNSFQNARTHSYADFTVDDMIAVAKASKLLRATPDLTWAMLISPDLFSDLARAFGNPKGWDFLQATITCSGDVLDCTDLMKRCDIGRKKGAKYATVVSNADHSGPTPAAPDPTAEVMAYDAPLCPKKDYDGRQVLASFLDVMITFFWTDKRWITDVELYDSVIPQTITMC